MLFLRQKSFFIFFILSVLTACSFQEKGIDAPEKEVIVSLVQASATGQEQAFTQLVSAQRINTNQSATDLYQQLAAKLPSQNGDVSVKDVVIKSLREDGYGNQRVRAKIELSNGQYIGPITFTLQKEGERWLLYGLTFTDQ